MANLKETLDMEENDSEEEMDTQEQAGSDHDESDSDSSENDAETENQCLELMKQLQTNQYNYAVHVELIELLHKMGELEKLREAREKMSKLFPLNEKLWLQWIKDEISLVSTPEDRQSVIQLFERAVKDYTCMGIWSEYVQFSIGGLAEEGGMETTRALFERSLTAVGIHAAKGSIIWDTYREFEKALIPMMTKPEDLDAQIQRISTLYRRQLSCPLLDMKSTYAEWEEWIERLDDNTKPNESDLKMIHGNYKKASTKLEKIMPFELKLAEDTDNIHIYRAYVTHEIKEGDPGRVQCIYERAVTEHCLVAELWNEYTKYINMQLKISEIALPIHERSIRNCPWNAQLWLSYFRSAERYQVAHDEIRAIFHRAVVCDFYSADDSRSVWMGYSDYLRRKWSSEPQEETKDELHNMLNDACERLADTYGAAADPSCTILQHWARLEAIHFKDMETARQLWRDVFAQGHDRNAAMWLEYFHLERAYGDTKHLRKAFQRALNVVKDWPESIGTAWVEFERQEGTLDTYETAADKYKLRMVETEKERSTEETKQKFESEKKKEKDKEKRKEKRQVKGEERVAVKRKAEVSGSSDSDGFKIPDNPVSTVLAKKAKVDLLLSGPPTVTKPPDTKPLAEESDKHGVSIPHDAAKDERTVFISNLSYDTTEDQIREAMKSSGEITDLRLVRDFKGRSKGYCYVEYSSVKESRVAMERDREALGTRPMFISPCDPDKKLRGAQFKYKQGLEKNKLFVKGLPISQTKEDLENLFKPYGDLRDVRLVTYRNGHSKGLAFIDFEDETSAAVALLKTDGLKMGPHTISVAISNPPVRGLSLLSGSNMEMDSSSMPPPRRPGFGNRGRGRSNLSFVPRSVLQKPSTLTKNESNGSADNGSPSPMKSNQQFRDLLLGTKKE